jgi:hypothetical protein
VAPVPPHIGRLLADLVIGSSKAAASKPTQ